MWLKQISVLNFKNYTSSTLSLLPEVNAFTGKNGSGKTNLLDAIHYLSLCKSYFNPIDSQNIKKGEEWFMVQGDFVRNERNYAITCSLKRNQKKQFKRDKKDYPRLADHIGQFPLVMISPNDHEIITEGSEIRRKFIDNVISQTDHLYLDNLLAYNRILLQRNTLLKRVNETGVFDLGLLEVLNMQLVEMGEIIFQGRKQFIADFTPAFNRYYSYLTDAAEEVSLQYESQLHKEEYMQLLEKSLDRDRYLERTTYGIHKDDLLFMIHDEMPLKRFGSQGQQKSFLIALKLAQYSYLQEKKNFKPLLLLDDIFDKLDENRITKLMEMVSNDEFGQIFITDTDTTRILKIFNEINQPIRIFDIEGGYVKV